MKPANPSSKIAALLLACFGIFGQLAAENPPLAISGHSWLRPWAVNAGPDVSICQGGNTQLLATGANSYTWSPSTGLSCTNCANPVASPSVTTIYTVLGNDGTLDAVEVKVLQPPVITDVDLTQPTDCNLPNGSIVITTASVSPYEFSIDGGTTWQNTGVFTALPPGSYSVRVRSNNGICVVNGGNFTLVSPPLPQILNVLDFDPTFCDVPNGSIVISASGGISPLQYSVNGGQTWQAQNTFQLLGAGIYQVKIRNGNGTCVVNGPLITLAGSPDEAIIADIFKANPTNCGATDGLITLIVPNSGGQFEFSIDGGASFQASNSFSGLGEGEYEVVVRLTDGTCAVNGGVVELVSPNRPTIYGISSVNPQGCGSFSGNITILAFGASTLQFSIDDGTTWHASNIFSNLPVSTYEVKVRNDDGSCVTIGPIVTLTEPGPPVISAIDKANPTACGLNNGNIKITASGVGQLEYSINAGGSWQTSPNFSNLAAGSYNVRVRFVGGGCTVDYTSNPVVLTSPGIAPVIGSINATQPSVCGVANGSIAISATGSGVLTYSINGGTSFQASNVFNNLPAGTFPIVVGVTGGNCTTTGSTSLFYSGCTDTVLVNIPPSVVTNYCIDPSNFNNLGTITGAGFCGQGSVQNVSATSINQNCVTLAPASGFTGVSPNLICTVHCFNNSSTICDTTYLRVNVLGVVNCDPVFTADTVTVAYTGNPTNYCVPVPLTDLLGFELYLNGGLLSNPAACDYEPTTAYSYTFLPGAGFSGPYSLDAWAVNGNSFTGFFNDANGLLGLMQAFDPTGNWQINTSTGLIFGGNPNSNYDDMQVTHIPSGTETNLNTNTTFLPTGFTLALTDPGLSVLIVENPVDGCTDTLFINASFDPTTNDTIFLTTTVNTPTVSTCLSANELPGGNIASVGYCGGPTNGAAPLTAPTCVYYIPNLNFAGQDQFCMVACDGNFPQTCDTTIFIVNVLPENDTVFLTIPAGVNSVDTCLSNFVIELPGGITSASFCGINSAQISGTLNGNCLVFNANGSFYGTTTVCANFCSGSVCDQNTIIVTIVPPIVCDDVFAQSSQIFTTPTVDNGLCIPIPPGDIVNYSVTVDGAAYTQSFTPCGFDNLVVYSYTNLPAGPYTINTWTANGTLHSGVVSNITDLVAQLNIWDVNGDWALNTTTQTIQGGQGGTYSNLVITPAGGASQTLTVNLVQFPLGSEIQVSGYGTHVVTVTAANGCSDTLTVTYNQHLFNTDTLFFTTTPNTSVGQICGNTSELLGNLFSISFCGLPANGGFVPNTATCFTYTPNFGFVGTDVACIVLCDDNLVPVCDTFIFVIDVVPPVLPTTDTLFLTAANNLPFDTCLNASVLQLPGVVTSATICGSNAADVTLTLTGNCVAIDLADSFSGTTTACVVHCDDSSPSVCDTTYLVITQPNVPTPCPTIFNPDNGFVSLQNGVGTVCLPIAPAEIVDYIITLDGQPYTSGFTPCDLDSVVIYSYGQVFGQGANGPYSVSWTINGQNFSSVVQNVQALVAQMNVWDFAGNWNIEQPTFSIISTNDNGVYGNLIITHIATGILSTLAPDFNSIPFGTAVQISGSGQHEIIVQNQVDGCADTLTINALNGVDQLNVQTVEDVPSDVICLDITGLPGAFEMVTICQQPANGLILISNNCFTFSPDPGFVGNNTACVAVCDNLGNCDTTLLNITVDPLCSLFDFFPDTTINFQVLDCADVTGYCTPILLDSIASYGVLDNGFPYAGGFVVCNGQFAQIALDTGEHEIVFVHFGTGCQDTLFADVSCTTDDGCGIVPLTSLTLNVDDCSESAQFCLSVLATDLPNFVITDNGAAFGGTIGICDLNGTTVGMTIDTGLHVLILEDTVKGCADTFNVNVLCTIIEDVTIDTTVEEGDSLVLCLEDFGFLTAFIDSVNVACTGNGNTSFIIDDQTWCITIFGETVGLDTACFEVFVGDTSAVFTANIEVTSPCPVLIPSGNLALGVDCSLDSALLCLPFNFLDLVNKTILLDGQSFTGPFEACGFTSLSTLNYDELPSQGLIGPYIIENWNINGTDFTGVFNTIQELADSMNLWDPTGTWQVVFDPINNANLIQGGDSQNTYSGMAVEQQISGVQVVLGISLITVPTGVAIEFETGTTHTLTITDTVTLCSETAILELACVNSEVVTDTILVGQQDTFCLDLSELVGTVVSVTNNCPGSNGEIVGFTIDSTCIIYAGNEPGLDSACIVVCDDAGLCDTTYFFITVGTTGDSLPIAVDDEVLMEQGDAANVMVLSNDTVQFLLGISIINQPAHGEVGIDIATGTITYNPDDDYCDEDTPDSFTYAICNPAGCDTATVTITVLCSDLFIFQAFSPNGDGKNETFKINGLQNYQNHQLTVYNRWGVKVYEATNYLSDWEGTYKDKLLPDGTYFYVLDLGNGGEIKSGYVVILR